MFGELVGLWAAHAFARLGSPDPVALVELGPGRGTLMADALRAIGKRGAGASRGALAVHLVETSPALRARQAQVLADAAPRWHDGVGDPAGNAADRDRQRVLRRAAGHPVRPRRAGRGTSASSGWRAGPSPSGSPAEPIDAGRPAGCARGQRPRARRGRRRRDGASWRGRIATQGGAAARRSTTGRSSRAFGDTLQAVAATPSRTRWRSPARQTSPPMSTSRRLARVARGAGRDGDLATSQGDFLDALGLAARAQALRRRPARRRPPPSTPPSARLTDRSPTGMGALFKVLAIRGAPA